MLQHPATVYLLISGSDHEGGYTVSVHATEAGAKAAALAFMGERDYNQWRPMEGRDGCHWRAWYQPVHFDENGEMGMPGDWEEGCDYVLVRPETVQP